MTIEQDSTYFERTTWFDEEHKILLKMAGYYSLRDITRSINTLREQFKLNPRNLDSIRGHAALINISLLPKNDVYFTANLEKILAISSEIIKQWRTLGWLKGRPWGYRYMFLEQEVLDLINARPWLFDTERMPASKFKSLLEVLNRRDPWLRVSQIALLLNCAESTLYRYIHMGEIPYERRVATAHAPYMLRASQLPSIREVLRTGSKRRPPSKLQLAA